MSKNTKRWLKIIGSMVIGGVIGAFFGGLSVSDIMDNIPVVNIAFIQTALICVVIGGGLAFVGVFLYCSHCRSRIKKDHYSNEEDSVYEKISTPFGLASGIGTAISVTLTPLSFSILVAGNMTRNRFAIVLIMWISVMSLNLMNEISTIKVVAKIDPSKDVDWSKAKINEHFYNKLDECEKEQIGMTGAKIINRIHFIFGTTFIVAVLLGLFLEFSGFEYIIIGLLWGFFTFYISINSCKKKKNHIINSSL